MIVEDNAFSSLALSSQIQQFDLQSDIVYDGNQAINIVKQRWFQTQTTYRLIFMDLYMPRCNGKESVKAIREFLSDKSERPYICMISSADEVVAQKYGACEQIDSYESKPIFKKSV